LHDLRGITAGSPCGSRRAARAPRIRARRGCPRQRVHCTDNPTIRFDRAPSRGRALPASARARQVGPAVHPTFQGGSQCRTAVLSSSGLPVPSWPPRSFWASCLWGSRLGRARSASGLRPRRARRFHHHRLLRKTRARRRAFLRRRSHPPRRVRRRRPSHRLPPECSRTRPWRPFSSRDVTPPHLISRFASDPWACLARRMRSAPPGRCAEWEFEPEGRRGCLSSPRSRGNSAGYTR